MATHGWSEFGPARRAAVTALALVEIALAATAWADLLRRPADQVNGGKLKWAAIICINFVGPLAYFRWGRTAGQGHRHQT